jgi:hypothetical protein
VPEGWHRSHEYAVVPADVQVPGVAVTHEPTTVAPRTDGSEETLGGELEAEPLRRVGAVVVDVVVVVVVVVAAEVVVVEAGLVVVVLVDGVVVVPAAPVVVGAGGGLVETPIEVVSGPLPAQGLPLGIA